MEMKHIALDQLKRSPLNVRKHGTLDGDDFKPSIRSLGVLQPLLVRPNCEGYEIIAGGRRFAACTALAEEGHEVGDIPCAVMDEGDDANAIEASLAENIDRLPMDEIDQYQAFSALKEQGRGVEDIAASFGVTERLVNQRLAISNLYNPILNAYRRDEIRASDVRILTMATKRQQKAWWKLFRDENEQDGVWAPSGSSLKNWLFGGEHIPTTRALFDLADYTGSLTSDLFGEDVYFGDLGQFWSLQSKAIAEKAEAYSADGWQQVTIHEAGEHWCKWNYRHCDKAEGGEVHITCTADGEVMCHEGYLHEQEMRRREKQQEKANGKAPAKPELTKSMQNYLELHRHNAVRVELLKRSDIALRLSVAHMVAGSDLWNIRPEPQKANTEAIDGSIADSTAQDALNVEAMEIRSLLGITDGGDVVGHGYHGNRDIAAIFATLLELDDGDVMRILTFAMAETLQSGSGMVEALGTLLNVDMRNHWQPDQTFFDLFRDKQAINAMVRELAGKQAADANCTATAKVQKSILAACVNGTRKAEVEDWQPRYMAFPMQAYTDRGGIAAMDKWADIAGHFPA